MSPPLLLAILIVAMIIVAYEMNQSLRTQYRKGCNECDAAIRRVAEEQRELQHDVDHRGFKARGFPMPTVDRYECGDPACSRNENLRNRPGR